MTASVDEPRSAEGARVVLCTAPSEEVAGDLARRLLAAHLAACVNVIGGMTSFYVWEGSLQRDPEVQLVIKTCAAKSEALVAWLEEHHPYDVPEVLVLAVEAGSAPYLEWMATQTADASRDSV